MIIDSQSEYIRYTGRWGAFDKSMAATATGSYFEIVFRGDMLLLTFNTAFNSDPFPHLYIKVDNGPRIESPLSPYFRITGAGEGFHHVTVMLKSCMEMEHRWHLPLVGKVALVSCEADGFAPLPEDNRKTIEFVGDSITEGVLINPECAPEKNDQCNRPVQDDVTATYAYLTAEALGLRPLFMGYGAVGATKGGCGGVPDAKTAYPYNFEGSEVTYPHPDYILINHGANDSHAPSERFCACYYALLEEIRIIHPESKIFVLTPFSDRQRENILQTVDKFNKDRNDSVVAIDSHGWIPQDPLHPHRDGHKTVADHLIPILRPQL